MPRGGAAGVAAMPRSRRRVKSKSVNSLAHAWRSPRNAVVGSPEFLQHGKAGPPSRQCD